MTTPLVTIIAACDAQLATIAEFKVGEAFLAASGNPPRFVWIVRGASSRGPRAVGGNPRSLHDDLWNVEVHCWGKTLDQAMLMRQALVTVVRDVVHGRNYELGSTEATSDKNVIAHGHLLVVNFQFLTPLASTTVTPLAVDERLTVRPTDVQTQPGAVPATTGDGVLDAPNES